MPEFLTITPGEIPTRELHQFLLGSVSPRPIGFASTIDKEGQINLSPYSFFNVFSAKPPVCIFSPARRVRNNTTKHTLGNVMEVPEVVLNTVSYDIVEQMSLSSTDYAKGVNEFEKAGLTQIESELVRPPRVLESPMQMECKVIEIKPLSADAGAGNLVICKVLRLHVNREILDEDQTIDPHKIDVVGRMGKNFYVRASGKAVFEVAKPLTTLGIGVDQLPENIRTSNVLSGNDLGKLGNIESLPDDAGLASFQEAQSVLLESIPDAESLHHVAKSLLEESKKVEALHLLMLEARLFGMHDSD